MRPLNLTKWEVTPLNEGLLFFCEALNELCFDHTLDSYKAPALNLVTSAHEVAAIAHRHTENDGLPKQALSVAIEELHWHIKNDPVLRLNKKNIAKRFGHFIRPELSAKELYFYADALIAELRSFYWPDLKELIMAAVAEPKRKKDIHALATSFISEAEIEGFPRAFVYRANKLFIFSKASPSKIVEAQQLQDFLKFFPETSANWTVIFRGSKSFSKYQKYHEAYRFKTSDSVDGFVTVTGFAAPFFEAKEADQMFLIFPDIRAKCSNAARDLAVNRLEYFADTIKLHFHVSDLSWAPACIVTNKDTGFQALLKECVSPMESGVHIMRARSTESFEKCVRIIADKKLLPASLQALSRLIEYHRAAFDTKWNENQLLNLWAAFEGFLPAAPEGISRIEFYQRCLLPSTSMSHAGRLAHDLADSLYHFNQPVRNFITQLKVSEHFVEKTLCLLICDDLKTERLALYGLLETSPLLIFRCNQFHDQFASSHAALSTLKEHRQKVSWHLQRIYTSRNQIVHHASSLPYLSTLVQNLHAYVDLVVEGVTNVASSSPRSLSISSALKILEVTDDVYLKKLEETEIIISTKNCIDLLIGSDNLFPLLEGDPV